MKLYTTVATRGVMVNALWWQTHQMQFKHPSKLHPITWLEIVANLNNIPLQMKCCSFNSLEEDNWNGSEKQRLIALIHRTVSFLKFHVWIRCTSLPSQFGFICIIVFKRGYSILCRLQVIDELAYERILFLTLREIVWDLEGLCYRIREMVNI